MENGKLARLCLLFLCLFISVQIVDKNSIPEKMNLLTRAPATKNNFIKNCSNAVLSLLGNKFYVNDFNWAGDKLSDVQITNLVKFTKNAGRKIQKGDSITIWTTNMVKMNEAVGDSRYPQFISVNTAFEDDLIKDSLIDSKPREVLQIRYLLNFFNNINNSK